MLIEIRRATAEDISRALNFYAERRYGGGIRPEDAVLLAEHDGELVGILRLTAEEGVVVLRGMQVHAGFQRQGIGNRLLATVAQELDGRDCFCIPYAHLVGFYGGIGFRAIEPAKAPTFLRRRLERYQDRGDGKEYLIMHRVGVQEDSSQVRADTSWIS
jgi:N-acetylglutamate synthase-like GNAT family acetyltransferase